MSGDTLAAEKFQRRCNERHKALDGDMINKFFRATMVFFVALIPMGCASGKALDLLNGILPSSPYTLTNDVAYGTSDRQMMDIYRSKNDNGMSIIFVYGGAWREGNKADYEFVAHALTRRGYNVVIPDYRLFPQVKFPSFISDIADAIKQYENTEYYSADRGIVLMGHSSGAHTAALLTTNAEYFNQAGVSSSIRALVAMAGPYDLPIDDPEVAPVFPGVNDTSTVNPTQSIVGKLPPVLLLHGKADERVLIKHTFKFADAIMDSGNLVTVKAINGGHAGVIAGVALPLRFLNDSFDYLIDFLDALDTKPKAD